MQRRLPTIRSTLLWLVIACVLPASLMTIGLAAYNYQREQDYALLDATMIARSMMATDDNDLVNAQTALFALGTSLTINALIVRRSFLIDLT